MPNPQGRKRGGRDGDELDPTSAGGATTTSEGGNVADQLKDALTRAACAISGLACSNQLIVEGVARVIGDGANGENVIGTPNEGPRGVTVIGTPDTGEKGPSIFGTPDEGEHGATVIATPDQGKKSPIITATPNEGPLVFDPVLNGDSNAVDDDTSRLPPLRQEYENEVRALEDVALNMRASGANPEQVARKLHELRRELGVKYKDQTPQELLDEIHARNEKKYGDKLGPTVEWLRSKGKTWEYIIEKSSSPGGKDINFTK